MRIDKPRMDLIVRTYFYCSVAGAIIGNISSFIGSKQGNFDLYARESAYSLLLKAGIFGGAAGFMLATVLLGIYIVVWYFRGWNRNSRY